MELINMTIGECLDYRAKISPEEVYLEQNEDIFTWKFVSEITNKLALLFLEKGIRKGTRVGILGVNSPNWIFSYFAVVKLGAVAVLINACSKEREIIEFIKAAKIEYLLYTSGYNGHSYEKMVDKLKTQKDAENIEFICMQKDNRAWEQFMSEEINVECKMPQVKYNELSTVLFTSGTTGQFKGVKHSHYSLVNNAKAIVENLRWTKDDCMCLAVPLFHCFGVTVSLIASLIAGFKVVVLEKYNTLNVCRAVQDNKCTIFNGVPSMFLAMQNNEERSSYNLDSLKSGIIAGSPIYKDDYMEICNMLKNMRIQTSYGLTETSPCVSVSEYEASNDLKALNVGKVIEHVQVKIIDTSTGDSCDTNELGEICVKGYNVAMGYLSLEGEEYSALDDNGWLKTGDIGYINENGYLHITCRKKNIIIIGGENVLPDEITKLIKEVSGRKEVFVFGIKSRVMQEEIVACIEGSENYEEVIKIKEYLNENLSKFKIPKHYVFLDKFPRNSTGKLDEKTIKENVFNKLRPQISEKLCI